MPQSDFRGQMNQVGIVALSLGAEHVPHLSLDTGGITESMALSPGERAIFPTWVPPVPSQRCGTRSAPWERASFGLLAPVSSPRYGQKPAPPKGRECGNWRGRLASGGIVALPLDLLLDGAQGMVPRHVMHKFWKQRPDAAP